MRIEVSHPIHPQHKLKPEYTEIPFNCDGCKEAGIGLKHRCQQCEFDLHKSCAVAPPTITHPFYKKWFVYHCKRCGFDLHPCCANLPQVLNDGERNLYLCLKLSNSCYCCGGKGPGWSYRSKCKTYNLHVSCVKKLLLDNWQAMHLKVDSNKVRELQTRIPSLGGTLKDHHGGGRGGGKASKCSQIATGAISAVVSAILGDPTAIIAAAVGALLFK
ncbi:hypothetical protein CK203_069577 [Vitis vinifera]|uniref:Phorbol-ester/DAG-type domain-containing protein n=1 Tax=Vitis vinifera TaxID=29760 RepID=A0A438EKZ9_VITVI|nr:hypothetical protein CK203_069577 [Vitis vinifera]